MNVVNLYKKVKQILNDSNVALANKGLNSVDNLCSIPSELNRIGVNRLPYVLSRQIIEVTVDDLIGVTSIGDGAFYECDSLTSVTIPNSVTSIGENAFCHCTSLQSVTLGDSVTTIGRWAFYQCFALTSVTIPDSVTSIGRYAFDACGRLKNIYFLSTIPPTIDDKNAIPDIATMQIHVPVGSGDAYRNATNWSYYASRIVEDVEVE